MNFDRRFFLKAGGLVTLSALAGCSTTSAKVVEKKEAGIITPEMAAYEVMYAAQPNERFPLPAIPYKKINQRLLRQWVDNPTGERPGTVVVDVGNHYLYFTYANGKAMRYGVGLGRAGFSWAGTGVIQYKREWPTWTPPAEMIARQPELEKYSAENGGQQPGLTNPLGARALYIFQNNEDTLYRIHGSPEWNTIGKSVSSGCVRMINQDVIDLYGRVPDKTRIVVTNLKTAGAV